MSASLFDGFDRIALQGLRVFGHHGVLPEERRDGQWFVVDVELHLETREAGRTDDLRTTVDYAEIARIVNECVATEPLNLIEALAQRIADRVLAVPRIQVVEVTVHKPSAPIPYEFADVAVNIVRMR